MSVLRLAQLDSSFTILPSPTPGWYRFTFTTSPQAIQEGLSRVEKTLGLEPFSKKRPMLDLHKGMEECPADHDQEDGKVRTQHDSDISPMNLQICPAKLDARSFDDSMRKSWDTRDETAGHELEKGEAAETRSLLKRLTCGLL